MFICKTCRLQYLFNNGIFNNGLFNSGLTLSTMLTLLWNSEFGCIDIAGLYFFTFTLKWPDYLNSIPNTSSQGPSSKGRESYSTSSLRPLSRIIMNSSPGGGSLCMHKRRLTPPKTICSSTCYSKASFQTYVSIYRTLVLLDPDSLLHQLHLCCIPLP